MSAKIYEAVTAKILDALERGVVPWKKPWHGTAQLPLNAVSQKLYRGVNTFLLSLSRHSDHRWLSLKQARDLGGSVCKGEKGSLVIFWKQWEKEPEEENGQTRSIPVLRYYHVWNAEQCQGLSLPALPTPSDRPEHERIARAEELVKSMIDPPRIVEGGPVACYSPTADSVHIPALSAFESPDDYYATLFHELIHACGHPNRLNRLDVGQGKHFGSSDYSREELVAELGSAFCCGAVSLDNSLIDNAASYISGWLKVLKADSKAVVVAAAQAQRSADWIKGVRYDT